jgi:hypothetical protein
LHVLFTLAAVLTLLPLGQGLRAACDLDATHSSVSSLFGQQGDPSTCATGVIAACNAVLVSPTVAVTSAECGLDWRTSGGIPVSAVYLNHNPAIWSDCAGADLIASFHPHPDWDGTNDSPFNVAVLVLAAASAQTPAVLPEAGAIDALLRRTPLDVVGYGGFSGGLVQSQRRVTTLDLARRTDAFLKVHRGNQCVVAPSGSGVFLSGTQQLVGLNTGSARGLILRLDTPEVRDFLGDFVTLP